MALTLQQLREKKGISVEELAEATGVKIKEIKALEEKNFKKVSAASVALIGIYFKEFKIQDITVF